ncbi:hypothetical protein ML401_35485 (plasmid) [Bradyrhizobium sp. 62B]|uniref:hypothetical protein n=1 Tax=Bradyrhizobium sp. 62B TaxID=2898442 RepID=UPI0025581CF7|nr:hypothetical protein ML401_35485 [Bradyrhizobium sp. 62B]
MRPDDSVKERFENRSYFPSAQANKIRVQLLRHLTGAALLACSANDLVRARQIVKGLRIVAPDGRQGIIAEVITELTADNIEAALRCVGPLAAANDPYGMIFQALALGLAGRVRECEQVLSRTSHGDPAIDELRREMSSITQKANSGR